jgi:hypothetical protein
MVHAHDGTTHRLAAVLPETAGEGAEVFRGRFEEKLLAFLQERGAVVDPTAIVSRSITFPGDDGALDALRADFERIDAAQHR